MRTLICLALIASLGPTLSPAAAQQPTTGEAQAFITDSLARLVFPLDPRRTYVWDVPTKGAYPSMPEFAWDIKWYGKPPFSFTDPVGLSMVSRWKVGGSHRGTLSDLIRGRTVDLLTSCAGCDAVELVHPQREADSVFASVERNRLVFNVRGREAVHRVFRKIPDTMFFIVTSRQTTPRSDSVLVQAESVQEVTVNCVPTATQRVPQSCLVQPVVAKRQPDADSAAAENAPRRVHVPVIRFENATLQKNVRVRLKTLYGKVWKILSTGSLGNVLITQPPIGPLLIEALCPRSSDGRTRISGTAFVMVEARQDTSVHMWSDPTVCPR